MAPLLPTKRPPFTRHLNRLVHFSVPPRGTRPEAVPCQARQSAEILRSSGASSPQTANQHPRMHRREHCPERGSLPRPVTSLVPERSAPRGRRGWPRSRCRRGRPLGTRSGATPPVTRCGGKTGSQAGSSATPPRSWPQWLEQARSMWQVGPGRPRREPCLRPHTVASCRRGRTRPRILIHSADGYYASGTGRTG